MDAINSEITTNELLAGLTYTLPPVRLPAYHDRSMARTKGSYQVGLALPRNPERKKGPVSGGVFVCSGEGELCDCMCYFCRRYVARKILKKLKKVVVNPRPHENPVYVHIAEEEALEEAMTINKRYCVSAPPFRMR